MTEETAAPEETADEAEAAPEPEAKPKARAKAKSAEPTPADALAEHLEGAHAEGLTGASLVFHELELGFVHALAGAADEAEACIARADAEVAKHHPNLSHLAQQLHLLKARIHAALSRR